MMADSSDKLTYPQEKLSELRRLIANEFPDLTPEAGTASKHFVNYECRPILFGDQVLWVSIECLTDEDDGPDTAANSAQALKNLDLDKELQAAFVRELLLTHRDDSTPERPARVLASWGAWKLVDPTPTIQVSR